MLASYVVNSVADDASGVADGVLTLREAITAANTNAAFGDAVAGDVNGDQIRFDASIASQTITLTNGEFTINDDLAILGDVNDVTIDANFLSRIFNVNSTEQVVIRDVNLTNGMTANEGGAIQIAGTGSTNVIGVFVDNSVSTGTGGGAIAATDNTVLIRNSTVFANQASGVSGSGGGLLVNDGSVRVIDSSFVANLANRAGGAIEIIDGSLTVNNSALGGPGVTDGNIAGPAGTANPGNGGAIHVTGTSGTMVSLNGGSVQNNFAAAEGGGLWNQAGSSMNVNGTTISGNIADGDPADQGGGGVFNNGGMMRLRNLTLADNVATGSLGSGGGAFSVDGLLSMINVTVTGNMANRAGGGIEVVDGQFFMVDSVLGGMNAADGNIAGPVLTANPGNGGGYHVSGNLTDSYFRNVLVQNNVAAREGGGLWNQSGSTMRVVDSEILDNTASGASSDDGGGGIFNSGGTLRIRDSHIVGNIADGTLGSGGGIFSTAGLVSVRDTTIAANIANRAGGGIEVVDGRVNLRDTILGGTTVADGNIAGQGVAASPGNGGGLHVTGSTGTEVVVRGGSVQNNVAASEGGGLWNQAGSTLVVRSGARVSDNVASGAAADEGGGGIFNNGGTLRVLDSIVADNFADGASGSGGGLLTTDGLITIRDSVFSGNTANRAGGGFEIIEGMLLILDSVLEDNIAGPTGSQNPGNGGGVHVTGAAAFTLIDNSIVRNNFAANEGGGLWNQTGSTMNVANGSVVTGNFSGLGGGGGIFNRPAGILNVSDSTVSNNTTTGNGGGILNLASAILRLEDSDVSRNDANNGGGIFNAGDAFITDTVIAFNDAATNGGGIFSGPAANTNLTNTSLFGNGPNNTN